VPGFWLATFPGFRGQDSGIRVYGFAVQTVSKWIFLTTES